MIRCFFLHYFRRWLAVTVVATGWWLTLPAAAAQMAASTPTDSPPPDPLPDTGLQMSSPGNEELMPSAWDRDDWLVAFPKVTLLTLQGYFRVRTASLNRLDFDSGAGFEANNAGVVLSRFPAFADGHADYTTTNMRLRLQPIVHVGDNSRIVATFDVLDNFTLGTLPEVLRPGMLFPPVVGLSHFQKPPRYGSNSLTDTFQVKRLWAQASFLGEQLELQIGRVPDHFGLGMFYNSGDGLDCDYGMVADRLAMSFRLYNLLWMPFVQWQARTLMFRPFGYYDPQPLAAAPFGDAMEFGLRIRFEEHPDDVLQKRMQGDTILHYGMANAVRFMNRDFAANAYNQSISNTGWDPFVPPVLGMTQERRDLLLYAGDVYGIYIKGNFEIGTELALQAGRFDDTAANASNTDETGTATEVVAPTALLRTNVLMWGAALEAKYKVPGDIKGFTVKLKSGVASGDSHPGFGALNNSDTQRDSNDLWLTNFQFSPDYHVDRLLFRSIVGTVTDAFYLSPILDYRIDPHFLANLTVIYSQALFAQSTPSAAQGALDVVTPATPLGLELDATLAFDPELQAKTGQLYGTLTGAVLLPLAGARNGSNGELGRFAWAIQARVAATF